MLEQVTLVVEDGLSLSDVRARIKKLQNQAEALKRLPKTILAGRSWWGAAGSVGISSGTRFAVADALLIAQFPQPLSCLNSVSSMAHLG